MRWPFRRRTVDHTEAEFALVRAIEDKHVAESKWLLVAEMGAIMDRHIKVNGFGEDLKAALGRRRT